MLGKRENRLLIEQINTDKMDKMTICQFRTYGTSFESERQIYVKFKN